MDKAETTLYRSRREWMVAEGVLGYIAVCLGLSGLVFSDGLLSNLIRETGELLPWAILLIVAGLGLIITAVLERNYRDRGRIDCDVLRKYARWRKRWNLALIFCWSVTFLFITFYTERRVGFLMLLSPGMVAIHVRGAWEHVKAYSIRATSSGFPTLSEYVKYRLRSGEHSQ